MIRGLTTSEFRIVFQNKHIIWSILNLITRIKGWYLRNIKHFPCWYTVISTRVEIGKTSVFIQFRVFPIFTSVDITVYQYRKNVLYFFYNIAQRTLTEEWREIFRVDIELQYINTAVSQSAFRIYKCYIINIIINLSPCWLSSYLTFFRHNGFEIKNNWCHLKQMW